jgi:2-phospho-L-lactate guanylyltransferase
VRLILPVKRLECAKSRLRLSAVESRLVAEALALRTLDVALHCLDPDQVLVLTADGTIAKAAVARGVQTRPDPSGLLNVSLTQALEDERARVPHVTLAVLVVDLPTLSPSELAEVLAIAAASPAARHVADHCGTGTTFISVPPLGSIAMMFGPDSAQRFLDAGAEQIRDAPPGARADLDTPTDMCRLTPTQKSELMRWSRPA